MNKLFKVFILCLVLLSILLTIACSDDESSNVNMPDNFIKVPGGTFTMGRTQGTGQVDALPLHQVTLSTFYMSMHEVTQEEYSAIMDTNPSSFVDSNKPVENVSWYDAIAYCNTRSIEEELTPCYDLTDYSCDFSANGYRLPTEAEWEYAARGASDEPDYLYSGSDDIDEVAVTSSNSDNQTSIVGSKEPNALGFFDMSGNVDEWCWDWYGNYDYESQLNPTGPETGGLKILRGGDWISSPQYGSVSIRVSSMPSYSGYTVGFRVVRR